MFKFQPSVSGSLGLIGVVVGASATAFACTAGWLSPERLTPTKLVDALAPATGPALGRRCNHAKGICFTGVFAANGAGAELSRARVFARGEYPVLGASISGPPIRMRRTRPSACEAWASASRHRTVRNGAAQ